MSDDLLNAATQALKEESTAEDADGRFTRARVMASLHQGRVKRRTRLAFLLPLAACLAGGTAWGAATGRLPAMFQSIGELVSYSSKAPPEPRPRPASVAPSAGTTPVEKVSPPPPEPEPAREAPAPAKALPVAPPSGAAVIAAPSSSAAFRDTDGDLYRLAHEAHFARQDYVAALVGWDAYLRAAPGGRLATEARYNRAICLLRLGRDAEARRALEPFATGFMGYRQNEARELLSELPP